MGAMMVYAMHDQMEAMTLADGIVRLGGLRVDHAEGARI